MDKKDIYEHLAKIYLDASSKKNKPVDTPPKIFKKIIFVSFVFIAGLGVILYFNSARKAPFTSEISLVLLHDAAKINFHFDPAKKEIYTLGLNNLNLSPYKALGFSVKKADYEDSISLRVEFNNIFNEKSEVYFKDIPHRWKEYRIEFSKFKEITDWTEMSKLLFAIEEWNVRQKNGVVYIDNVRLLK
ncbi:MAG: hypothetical protein ABIH19_01630 [Candidatus Omnitrophota bacterium]